MQKQEIHLQQKPSWVLKQWLRPVVYHFNSTTKRYLPWRRQRRRHVRYDGYVSRQQPCITDLLGPVTKASKYVLTRRHKAQTWTFVSESAVSHAGVHIHARAAARALTPHTLSGRRTPLAHTKCERLVTYCRLNYSIQSTILSDLPPWDLQDSHVNFVCLASNSCWAPQVSLGGPRPLSCCEWSKWQYYHSMYAQKNNIRA